MIVVQEFPMTCRERRADALGILAESFLAVRGSSSKTADHFQVIVHVDAETLRESTPGRCEIENGPSIPAETAQRLACDCSLLRIIENRVARVAAETCLVPEEPYVPWWKRNYESLGFRASWGYVGAAALAMLSNTRLMRFTRAT